MAKRLHVSTRGEVSVIVDSTGAPVARLETDSHLIAMRLCSAYNLFYADESKTSDSSPPTADKYLRREGERPSVLLLDEAFQEES